MGEAGSDEVDEIFLFAIVVVVLGVVVLIRFVGRVEVSVRGVLWVGSGALVAFSFCDESSFRQTSENHNDKAQTVT